MEANPLRVSQARQILTHKRTNTVIKGQVGYTVYNIRWTTMMAIEKGEGLRWV